MAEEAILYSELHEIMRELIKKITKYNLKTGIPLLANEEDHAGQGIALELAKANKEDIQTYIDYYLSNDLYSEVYQGEDIEEILEKWGICEITYPLLVARWFEPSQQGET